MLDDELGSVGDRPPDVVEVRPCSAEDLAELRSTWPIAADVAGRHFARQRSGAQTLMVAWQHGEAMGSVVIRWRSAELAEIGSRYPGVIEVAHLQVRSDHRRRGVGTCLMQAAERQVRLRKAPWIGLGVGVENPQAAALYEHLGYIRTGLVARSEYDFLDENGVQRHAIEWNEYMIMDLR